jgi:hypothetical protein
VATAEEDPDEPPGKPKPSGRPAIQMGPSKKIESTFGATPGAVLKLSAAAGTITWRVPEFALGAGYNIEFKIADGKQAKKMKGGATGDVAYLKTTLGEKVAPSEVDSSGDAFELIWPLGTQTSVNLAVGQAKTDDQGTELKDVTWKVYAPKSVDTSFKEATFQLSQVGPILYLHATTAPPTEAAPAPAPAE